MESKIQDSQSDIWSVWKKVGLVDSDYEEDLFWVYFERFMRTGEFKKALKSHTPSGDNLPSVPQKAHLYAITLTSRNPKKKLFEDRWKKIINSKALSVVDSDYRLERSPVERLHLHGYIKCSRYVKYRDIVRFNGGEGCKIDKIYDLKGWKKYISKSIEETKYGEEELLSEAEEEVQSEAYSFSSDYECSGDEGEDSEHSCWSDCSA